MVPAKKKEKKTTLPLSLCSHPVSLGSKSGAFRSAQSWLLTSGLTGHLDKDLTQKKYCGRRAKATDIFLNLCK